MHREPIYKYMTVCPLTVGRQDTLGHARELMESRGIRHLPVLDEGVLVGVISERDLDLASSLRKGDATDLKVEAAMTPEPYVVSPDASLTRVAEDMARRKYGSAIVVERGHVAGVFTTVDALRVLAKLCEARDTKLSAAK